ALPWAPAADAPQAGTAAGSRADLPAAAPLPEARRPRQQPPVAGEGAPAATLFPRPGTGPSTPPHGRPRPATPRLGPDHLAPWRSGPTRFTPRGARHPHQRTRNAQH